MFRHALLLASFLCAAVSVRAATDVAPAPAGAPVYVRIETTLGPILVQVETERAPLTAANFLRYVDQKRFDGSSFYRAMKIGDTGEYGLVQGGLRGDTRREFKPVAHEPTSLTGLSHLSGALSMARAEPGTATADFFIVLGNLVSLDAKPADAARGQPEDPGYAVFARVVDGMDVVKAILEQPVSATQGPEAMRGQMLEQPVRIQSVRRVPAPTGPAPAP